MFRIQASENSVSVYRQKGSDVVKYSPTSDRVLEVSTAKNVEMTELEYDRYGSYFLTKDGICTIELRLMHRNSEEFKDMRCLKVNFNYFSAIRNRHVVFFHRETMRPAFDLKLDPSCIDMDDKTLLVCSGNKVGLYSLNSILVRSGFDWAESRYKTDVNITACALYGGVVILYREADRSVVITNCVFTPKKVVYIEDPSWKRETSRIKISSSHFLIVNSTQALLFNLKSGEFLKKFVCDDAGFYHANLVLVKNGILKYVSIVDGISAWEHDLQEQDLQEQDLQGQDNLQGQDRIQNNLQEYLNWQEEKNQVGPGQGSGQDIFKTLFDHIRNLHENKNLNNFVFSSANERKILYENEDVIFSLTNERKILPEKRVTGLDTVTDDEKKQCRICCQNIANVCYAPCGHVFSCVACCNANPSDKCAVCRTVATSYVKVYLPE